MASTTAAALVGALLGSCSAPGTTNPPAPTESCTGSPVIDGSRRPCLEPPYAPAAGATTLADGTPFVRDEGGRRFTFALEGEMETTAEALTGLRERVSARGGPLTFLGYGLYCGPPEARRICLHLRVDLCEATIDALAGEVLAAIAEDPILPRPRAELAISLGGLLGPRCGAEEGGCEPIPFSAGGTPYDPDRKRGPRLHLGGVRGGACVHDGECVIAGCGNRCHHWSCPGANEAGTCEGYSFSKPVYCGCVRAECGFFSQ
ncbi:MAG: hypothetical protein H6711_20485 [Myxococcales bacterium]|nr:hypothetical protein [Myxococcales bacterium]